jgi:hypothetical protein
MLRLPALGPLKGRSRVCNGRGRKFCGWLALLAAVASCGLGCTYTGGNRPGAKAQRSTADPYTYEFEKRIPPGGD